MIVMIKKDKLEVQEANKKKMGYKRENQMNLKSFNKPMIKFMTVQAQRKIKIAYNNKRRREKIFGKQ